MEKLHEDFEKKKQQSFNSDTLRVGCTKGFIYFSMYLRGKEELLLKVQNEQVPTHPVDKCFREEKVTGECSDDEEQTNAKNLPRACDSLLMSKNTQHKLSQLTFLGGLGLPPASPSETEQDSDSGCTLFLIGSYSRYKSPYVWVRSNHHRLVSFTDIRSYEDLNNIKDSPLRLQSTIDWKHKDVNIWDVLAEVVRINVVPAPCNPLAVDHAYFETLPPEECILATGAMVHFLNRVLMSNEPYKFRSKVSEDLEKITRKHFVQLNLLLKG